METGIERECGALGGLFHAVIGDMKSSYPVWEDFISKAAKLQSQLRTTVAAVAAFLDAFQKVADLATSSRGATRDVGSALTRMCMRHRSIEAKLRQVSGAFSDCLVNPLQDQVEEWKRGAQLLDKDHAKEYKRARQEIKKKSSDTLRLQKKAKKGRGDIQPQLNCAMQDVSDKYLLLEETEKLAVRKALIEERARFCSFVSMLRPVVDEEISMLGEITHLQTISDDLKSLTLDPHKLPPASEQVIHDLKGSEYTWTHRTPPSSPNTTMSRKSSVCSMNSVNSTDSRSSGSHSHSPSPHYRYRSSTLPQQAPPRLSSISSHDSGFISQDAFQSKSPSPMPPEAAPPLSNGFEHYGLCESLSMAGLGIRGVLPSFPNPSSSSSSSCSSSSTLCSWSRPNSALLPDYPHFCTLGQGMFPSSKVPTWKDWARPGPYDQPMVNTLRRKKEKETTGLGSGPERTTPASRPADYGPRGGENGAKQQQRPVDCIQTHEDLATALSRGLQLNSHAPLSSRASQHGSSGYSTQTTTPSCSEDTIPSQGTEPPDCCSPPLTPMHMSDHDYFSVGGDQEGDQQDFDKSSTIPRNSDIGQSYRRMFQTKRPASTAGVPLVTGPVIITPGVATIRRTPSTKPSVRRATIGGGPIPIRTPVIPAKMPAAPDARGLRPSGEEAEDELPSPDSPSLADGERLGLLPVASWSGQASTNPPVLPGRGSEALPGGLDPSEAQSDTMLLAIRRGVKLKRTLTNDRSAPRVPDPAGPAVF
ncbi:protein MTSS 1-like isoform X2 [Denticeps clupeoides]|uniref:protein MTSS 1-like isoform X2 n=1 Tax=Denticeps clupeoides TaxID=299321 RepID=UPI0010A39A58|nr:protein MTSS 1-like isoform X2 [Denticeps clupeoides]